MSTRPFAALALVLVQIFMPGSRASAAEATLDVHLTDPDHSQHVLYTLAEKEARGLENRPRKVSEQVERAKSDYAQRLGYTRERFGRENWKVVSDLRVVSITLKRDGRSVELRSAEMPPGTHDEHWEQERLEHEQSNEPSDWEP